jgi:hypothetical protein
VLSRLDISGVLNLRSPNLPSDWLFDIPAFHPGRQPAFTLSTPIYSTKQLATLSTQQIAAKKARAK